MVSLTGKLTLSLRIYESCPFMTFLLSLPYTPYFLPGVWHFSPSPNEYSFFHVFAISRRSLKIWKYFPSIFLGDYIRGFPYPCSTTLSMALSLFQAFFDRLHNVAKKDFLIRNVRPPQTRYINENYYHKELLIPFPYL